MESSPLRIATIGYGTIARELLGRLAEGADASAFGALLSARARERLAAGEVLDGPLADTGGEVFGDVRALLDWSPDLVVECASPAAVTAHVPLCLEAGVDVIVVSVGALADAALASRLDAAARRGDARTLLPAGAIGGLDLLGALAIGGLERVVYRGTKPPVAWLGTPAEDALDLETLRTPAVFFEGDAREAARRFPKNANVAATLALHGAGFEDTRVTLVADPTASGNRHEIEVLAASGAFTLRIDGRASEGNARTSMTTVYSVLHEIGRWRRGA